MTAWSKQPEPKTPRSPVPPGKHLLRIAAFVLLVAAIGISYLWYSLHRYERIAAAEVTMLAESLEAVMHPEHIARLSGSSDDLDNPDYEITKASLIRMVQTTNPIHFAYLLSERDGQLIILMDSELPDSPDYSPPGQLYSEASEVYRLPFRTGQTTLTPPTRDRWGEWISALVPVRDPVN
ncbi:MAG: hypothetical protein GX153_04885 [Clostridiaceae bacterium]|nr:hypothetical protein [Clostridiaceae bacterium]